MSPFAPVLYCTLPVVPLVAPDIVSLNVILDVFAPVKLIFKNTSLGLLITLSVPTVLAIIAISSIAKDGLNNVLSGSIAAL